MNARTDIIAPEALRKARARLPLGNQLLLEDVIEAHQKGVIDYQLIAKNAHKFPGDGRQLSEQRSLVLDSMVPLLKRAICFRVDEAARLVDRKGDGSVHVNVRDLPRSVPPFDVSWFEYLDRFDPSCQRAGALTISMDWRTTTREIRQGAMSDLTRQRPDPSTRSAMQILLERDDIGWVVICYSFVHSKELGIICAGPVMFYLALGVDGIPVCMVSELDAFMSWLNHTAGQEVVETSAYTSVFATVATSLALLHCKNVTTPETVPLDGVQRHRRVLGKQPAVVYKTLKIDLMQGAKNRDAGHASSDIAARRLHMVRGHFATYGGDKGKLFGRLEGTYFFADHVRGDAKVGQVIKDYELAGVE